LPADLVGGAVVDAQGARTAADVNAVLGPGEGLLEDALAEIPRKKRASIPVPAIAASRRSWAAVMSWHSSTTMC
jgi:hypothetical protein